MTTATIPTPAGATKCWPWDDDNGQPIRDFMGSSWRLPVTEWDGQQQDIDVSIHGRQYPRGVERYIYCGDHVLTLAQARAVADALRAAADEAERDDELDGGLS